MSEPEPLWKKPMVWCIDPGAVASGIANYNYHYYSWDQFENPQDLYQYFYSCATASRDILLLEDYSHGGAFTLEAKKTIEIIGFVYNAAVMDEFNVIRVHKDKRLSGQGPAARLMGDTIATLKTDPVRKDAFSALSHCMVYYRENGEALVRDQPAS